MLTTQIKESLKRIIEAEDPAVFLVGIDVKRGRKSILSIKVDTDEGITLGVCTRLSRKINRWVDEEQPFGENSFIVEVSSPGVGYPLRLARQYPRNVGRVLEIADKGGERTRGLLLSIEGDELQIDTRITSLKGQKKPKNKVSKKKNPSGLVDTVQIFRFEDIIEAKVMID